MDYFAAIRAFLYAADLGSFSKAAEKIDVKTSTVSRHIKELESDLGIALFNRSTRGLVLTEGGKVLREHGLVALQHLEAARAVTASLNTSPQGVLRVTMPASFGRRHVIPHLPQFIEKYPRIDIDAVLTDDVLNLIDGEIDLAIRIGMLPDSQLMARKLATYRQIVCASPAYIAQHQMPVTVQTLPEHMAVRYPLSADDRWMLIQQGADHSQTEVSVRLHGRLRVDDTDAALELAIAGCGIALLPTWVAGSALRDGQLVQLLPDWEVRLTSAEATIWGIYPPKKVVSSKVRAFMDFYTEIYHQPGYW